MVRRTSALFLLSFLLLTFVGASFTFGAKSDFEARTKGAKHVSEKALDFVIPESSFGIQNLRSASKLALNGAVNGNILGETMHDNQVDRSAPRMTEHRGTSRLHFTWMDLDVPDAVDDSREMAYNAVDLSANCAVLHGTDGAKGQAGRAGYSALDVYPGTAFAIVAAHIEIGGPSYSSAYWDFGWQMGLPTPFGTFTIDYPTDIYGWDANEGVGPDNENIWPAIEFQSGTEEVLHMTTRENDGSKKTISYYRRVGSYGFDSGGNPNGTWSDQKVIDTLGHGDANVVASTQSDKVALIWQSSCLFERGTEYEYTRGWNMDVFYIISENQGADWVTTTPTPSLSEEANTGGPFTEVCITNYPSPYDVLPDGFTRMEVAWEESQGLFDQDDKLQIVFTTRIYTQQGYVTFRDGAIWHWSETNPSLHLIYRPPELWTNPEAYCSAIEYRARNASMISLAQCIAGGNSGNLYVTYTRFGHDGNPCGDIDLVNPGSPGSGVLNGYLYYTASDDGGQNWDRPQRVTNIIPTYEGCYPDSTNEWGCNTEVFGTLARFSRTETCGDDVGSEVMDLFYLHDLVPGSYVYTGTDVFTSNPMTWTTLPCRDVVYEPIWTDNLSSLGFGLCHSTSMLVAAPGEIAYDTITCINPGLLDNTFTITSLYDQGDGWITANPSSGTILASRVDTLDIEFAFTAPTNVGEPVTIEATINIAHDADDSPRTIPVCLTVASEFYFPDTATIATTCKQLRVWNTGRISGSGDPNVSLDYIDDCDTFGNAAAESYMYGGSIVFAWDDGTVQMCTDIFTNNAFEARTARAMGDLVIDDTSDPDYIKATGDFTTFDSTINGTVEYYIPQGDTACEFVIQKLFVTSASGAKNNVILGYAWDWDVPSDSGSDNNSFADETRSLLYMSALEADDEGEAEALAECSIEQQSNDRFAGVRFMPTMDVSTPKNAMTLDNATWMYSSGPYGDDAPLPTGPTYDLMLTAEGFDVWEAVSGSEDSIYVDLTMLATFGEFNLGEIEPIEIAFAMITGRTGETDFLAEADKAFAWAAEKGLITLTCCINPGDANNDGSFNVGDAVFTIAHVFKGGPAPACKSAADANHDNSVNVGDAVYSISAVFKGGPPPECGQID